MSKSYPSSGARASRILPQIFDLTGATILGGLNALSGFLRMMGLDRRLAERFRTVKARWCRWRLDRVVRVLLDASFAGIERLYHFEDLETEPLLCVQHRVDRLPEVKLRAMGDVAFHAADALARSWRRVEYEGDGEIQVSSCRWRRSAWNRPRRVVVLCRRELDQAKGHLFDAAGWSYSLFVTDRDWRAEEVARFAANAADLALKILARNLLVLYRDRGLALKTRERVRTLRRRYLWVVGRLVRRAGRWLLRLSERSPLQQVLEASPLRL